MPVQCRAKHFLEVIKYKDIFMTTEVEIIGQMHWLQIGRLSLYIPPQICDGCYEKELIGKRGEER